jgi:aspartate/methionine/tyrosine aminotransferase
VLRPIDLRWLHPSGIAPPWLDDALDEHLPPPRSNEILREHLAGVLGAEVRLVESASAGLRLLLASLPGPPGGQVVTLDTSWDAFPGIAHDAGRDLLVVPRGAGGAIDLDRLSAAIGPETRAVLVADPENPLGFSHAHRDLDGLADWCIAAGVPLILDWALAEFQRGPAWRPPEGLAWAAAGTTGKVAGATRWRVGAVTRGWELGEAARPAPRVASDHAAIVLHEGYPAWRADLYELVEANRRLVLDTLGADAESPGPAPCARAWVPGDVGAAQFAEVLREVYQVACVPGSAFPVAAEGRPFVRIALARPRADLAEAVSRLKACLEDAAR